MSDALILFPHQLFEDNVRLARGKRTWLVEDALYFSQYAFHQQKLVLHRASMNMHAEHLRRAGTTVTYVESAAASTMGSVVQRVAATRPATVHYIDPVDDWLERRLLRELEAAGIPASKHPTPMFLSTNEFLAEQFGGQSRYLMANFYRAQRKALGILVRDGKPEGGRWSFDAENRKRLPRKIDLPPVWRPSATAWADEAKGYVAKHFARNPGHAADFAYPVTYADARAWLADFVAHRLPRFGAYEDAMATDSTVLFHSVLTPMLNTGLLTPREVIDAALGAPGVPLNSLEGFVRQIIGWREFMRAAYVLVGRTQRTRNFWRHTRPLPSSFWTGTTGVAPVDQVIGRVLRHAYAHHIERLMVLSNFMLLCGFRPDDIYRWFMEMFIDAYDWVMVPNVYGMAQHADGGLITTKPYVSASSYLLRMSDFARGPWCETWDALFWRFVEANREFFDANPRLGAMARHLDRQDPQQRETRQRRAREFLARL